MRRAHRSYRSEVNNAFRIALLWAVVGSLLLFSVADANPLYFVLTMLGMLGCWFGSVRPNRPAPRIAINTVLLLVIALGGFEMLRVGVGVSAFAVFVALLLIVKLLDLRSPRDDAQVLVLCLSIMVAAVLTSNSFMTGLLMLIECVLLLRAIVLFQLYSVVALGTGRGVRMSKPTRIDIRSIMVATGFLCAIIGGVVFVVLPRNLGNQAFGQWGASRSVSGFSDQVELGRPGLISMSSKPVLDMTITDRDGMNIGEINNPPVYLRGAVLEVYNAGNWRRNSIMRVPLTERIRLFPPGSSLKPRGIDDNSVWDRQCEITMRSVSDGPVYLFTPWRPVEFRVGDRPLRLGFDFNRGLFLKDGMGGSLSYTVRSINDRFRGVVVTDGAVRSEITPTTIEPEIADLASQIVRAGGIEPDPTTRPITDDASAVRLLETHLRTQYTYTLDAQPVPSGRDATEWFLFERRTGHCEYYASALALMARSIGIPARVVTGYIASDFNPVTGQYVVRESNAHAWVECEVAPGQWRTFDGTPPDDFYSIHVPEPGLLRSLSRMYESIEFIWGRAVVGYDSGTRERIMGERIGDFGLTNLADRFLERLAAGRSRLVSRAALVAVIVFTSSLFLGIIIMRYQRVFLLLRRFWGVLIARLGLHAQLRARVGASTEPIEREVQRALAKAGLPRPAWQPLRTHLRVVQDELEETPKLKAALIQACDWIYTHRFTPASQAGASPNRGIVDAIRRSEKQARTHARIADDKKQGNTMNSP